jgi:hypothetical protein
MTSHARDVLGRTLTRRRLLFGGAALAAAGGATAAIELTDRSHSEHFAPIPVGDAPLGLPDRQFAWNATLERDEHGNPVPPRFNRLLFFDVKGTPSAGGATVLEAALRGLERRFAWSPRGVLFTVGWGPSYFTRALRDSSPIPVARPLSEFELSSIDSYDMVLHLAGDDETRLANIEHGLTRGSPIAGIHGPIDISRVLRWRETRTGFVGAGLPARHQHVSGIPDSDPVAPSARLFMGFKSSLKRNQATEDDIAIQTGPFADGTTMGISYMRLRLDSWYQDLDERQRVALMYAPQVTPEDVRKITTDPPVDPGKLRAAIRRHGVIGHAQTTARARRNGRPIILRRDFDTVDGDQAGLHFVSLQRTIDDLVRTRAAMNASSAQLQNPAITDTVNNGINGFIFVLKRGNYLIPPRRSRSFPLVQGRASV